MPHLKNMPIAQSVTDDISSDRDNLLWSLLFLTKDIGPKAKNKELRQSDISSEQGAVLFIIQSMGDRATPAEISRWLLQRRHSIAGLLRRMEKDGLVRMTKDLDGKDMIRVTLTEKGKRIYHQIIKLRSIHQIMSSLTKEQEQQLRSGLETLKFKYEIQELVNTILS
jgi:DNA-binding MarR family transcriptional regulator